MTKSARQASLAILLTFLFPISAFASGKSKNYRPKIFKHKEFQTLTVLTETILHDDEMPGANVAKASEFIDFQITYDPEIQERFRSGLKWLDNHSHRLYGRDFVKLQPEQRREMIECLEIKKLHRRGEEKGREFFELARRYTYMGFYASEEALRAAIPKTDKLPTLGGKRVARDSE